MHVRLDTAVYVCFSLSVVAAQPAVEGGSRPLAVPLVVPSGTPIRLYLTKRIPKRTGAPVEARVLDPVYAFDRQVIPAGAIVRGQVDPLHSISKWQRIRAILGGDFTPLHIAPVEFTTLVLPDGSARPLHTAESAGFNSLVSSRRAKQPTAATQPNSGVLAAGEQKVKDAIQGQLDRARSISDTIRGPDKKEIVEDYLMAKLPYHPQYVRKGTRFDAELLDPLSFGSAAVGEPLAPAGTEPQAESIASARLITPLSSFSSKQGEPVEAVLSAPVFSADHRLILPEGTRVQGTVVVAKRARFFHRGGQLRFTFHEVELPEEMARLQEAPSAAASVPAPKAAPELKIRTQANLQAAESTGKTPLKIDGEGGVQAKESRTRFIAAAAAAMIARRSGDNDSTRNATGQVTGQSSNVGGRTLGGGLGLGMLGSAVSQTSRYVGAAFGYYGLAWSLYSTVIARGSEVQFSKNAMVDIRFNPRVEPAAKKTP